MNEQIDTGRFVEFQISESDWHNLAKKAWACRENAYLFGKTAVGAAVLTERRQIYSGCNVEHRYRSHDIHAETNAISSMVACGEKRIIAVLVAAERTRFTPCGSCMDWIFQFGGPHCLVGYQGEIGGKIQIHSAHDLMPYYPE